MDTTNTYMSASGIRHVLLFVVEHAYIYGFSVGKMFLFSLRSLIKIIIYATSITKNGIPREMAVAKRI
jgi:hypothetical protein